MSYNYIPRVYNFTLTYTTEYPGSMVTAVYPIITTVKLNKMFYTVINDNVITLNNNIFIEKSTLLGECNKIQIIHYRHTYSREFWRGVKYWER